MGFEGGFHITDALNFGVNIQGSYSESVTQDVGIEVTAPAGKQIYRRVKQSWLRRRYLVDHYTSCGWDANTGRSDGAFPQEWDDASTIANNREFSEPYDLGDYNMDREVNSLDDAVL